MTRPRIASLHPAGSAWLAEIDALDLLVGGTPECAARGGVPVVMPARPALPRALHPSAPVARSPRRDLDARLLADVQPDLVLADGWDDAWPDDLGDELRSVVGREVDVWTWTPRTMRDVLELALRTGHRIGRFERTMEVMGARERELREWRERIGLHRRAPDRALARTVVISSLDPPVLAGGWIAELVDRAALLQVGPPSGEPAVETTWEAVRALAPERVVVAVPSERWDEVDRMAASGIDVLSPTDGRRVALYDPVGRLDLAGPGLHEAVLDLAAWAHGLDGRALDGRLRERQA